MFWVLTANVPEHILHGDYSLHRRNIERSDLDDRHQESNFGRLETLRYDSGWKPVVRILYRLSVEISCSVKRNNVDCPAIITRFTMKAAEHGLRVPDGWP